ncbi:unnamed protein product [Pleuronectes platessa]|uniref:HAT C-terminal dimerisation domain-containing protein n=1 Tax=Pleuronectes platessa TaxID=8262 RepID=A0A9N7VIT1_PLEPL|nr:unnamed protein product [Pleuronectes platessa]
MKTSRRSVAWDHFELKKDLVHCQHCEAIPEAGGDEEPALSDTDEGNANTGAAARLAKLARSHLCITATSAPSERVFSAAGLTVTRLHIQEFYEVTLLNTQKSCEQKLEEVNHMADKWERSVSIQNSDVAHSACPVEELTLLSKATSTSVQVTD